jgi:N4-(beta-N-acetylglucosaminyl)-L-asparaginase
MQQRRRNFLKKIGLFSAFLSGKTLLSNITVNHFEENTLNTPSSKTNNLNEGNESNLNNTLSNNITAVENKMKKPTANNELLVTTWNFGQKANEAAWQTLSSYGYILDAIETGINFTELDPSERSVGLGGRPDRDGHVTLDACIMDEMGNIGSVVCMEHIATPISVARKVMDHTPHVMLAAEGATEFAVSQGFKKQELMVPDSYREWQEWLKKSEYKPTVNIENHDTIGMIGMDKNGRLGGGCSTSGMAFKMRGRIGDSPIIGAGLFVDGEIGACTATGHGEEVIRVVGAHRVVMEMRNGLSPQAACEIAIKDIAKKLEKRGKKWNEVQIGFIAINISGEIGAYALQPGFTYAVRNYARDEVIQAKSLYQ